MTLFDTLSQHFAGDVRLFPESKGHSAPAHVNTARAALHKAANGASPRVSEALWGEAVNIIEDHGDWSLVQTLSDHYLGYIQTDQVSLGELSPTHRLIALQSHIYPAPDLKHPPMGDLFCGSLLRVDNETLHNGFIKTHDEGYIYARHLAPLTVFQDDPVDVALGFLETPYLWGGRSRAGIDCSGLVQIALQSCGIACPRDSDMQAAIVGKAIAPDDNLLYGDIIFFPGHVGLMVDDGHLLHANAHHMSTVIEPLADVVARLKPAHEKPISAIRRL